MTARDAVELCELVEPRFAIPVQYEGWAHFQEGRSEIEREFARAPEQVGRSLRWLPFSAPSESGAALVPAGIHD